MSTTRSMHFSMLSMVLICLGGVQLTAQDEYEVFTRSWSYFSEGQFDTAEQLADQYLEAGEDELMRANYLYLKGNISAKRAGQSDLAIDHFNRARQIYQDEGHDYGAYSASLGLSKVLINDERLAEAESSLIDNIHLGEANGYPVGYPYSLLANTYFLMGDYEGAMNMSYYSQQAFTTEGNDKGVADALISLGFYEMLSGYLEAGYQKTLEGQAKIAATGDGNKHSYSLLSVALYHKCRNIPTLGVEKQISNRVTKDKDEDLKRLLNFVESYDCSGAQLLEGEPPIPTRPKP